MQRILTERLGHLNLADKLIEVAIRRFEQIRQLPGLEKKPATGELITWVKVLKTSGVDPDALSKVPLGELPLWCAGQVGDEDAMLLKRALDRDTAR